MSGDHDDYAVEPVRGLPEQLPPGEQMLWQGSPHWGELAVKAFFARGVAIYFVALMAWRAGAVMWAGGDLGTALVAGSSLLPLALVAVGLLALASWMTARATVYTITNRRVVMRIGVALTKTINIPFKVIESASLQSRSSGRGDIALELAEPNRIGLFHLWPNARPWHVNRPQPSLRAISDAAHVADLLSQAMQAELASAGIASSVQRPAATAKSRSGIFQTPGASSALA